MNWEHGKTDPDGSLLQTSIGQANNISVHSGLSINQITLVTGTRIFHAKQSRFQLHCFGGNKAISD